jgi:hypothetical protein
MTPPEEKAMTPQQPDPYPVLDTDFDPKSHDPDYERITKLPKEQGYYCNGWQVVLIWCRTHQCQEWHWIDYAKVPDRWRPWPPKLRLVK